MPCSTQSRDQPWGPSSPSDAQVTHAAEHSSLKPTLTEGKLLTRDRASFRLLTETESILSPLLSQAAQAMALLLEQCLPLYQRSSGREDRGQQSPSMSPLPLRKGTGYTHIRPTMHVNQIQTSPFYGNKSNLLVWAHALGFESPAFQPPCHHQLSQFST